MFARSFRHALYATPLSVFGISALLLSGPVAAQTQSPLIDRRSPEQAANCQLLNQLRLPELARLEARYNPDGPSDLLPADTVFTQPPTLAAHCRVSGRVEPAVGFEIWLPTDWNGRLLTLGHDTFAGPLDFASMATRLNQGYAVAATDSGVRAGSLNWLADGGALRDVAYRAVYELTSKADVIVNAFYQRPADFRYFSGCSEGGRQGLMQAQRFPAGYDGIIAGAPDAAFVDNRLLELWNARTGRPFDAGPPVLSAADLALVTSAATAQCDAVDGVSDGVLEDPRRCNFDPARLQCGTAAQGRCLTAPKVQAVRAIYQGPRAAGPGLASPGFAIGSESGWRIATTGEPEQRTVEFLRRAVFADSFWNWRDFQFDLDYPLVRERAGWMLDATAPDLTAFRDIGARLLLFQGWADPVVPPEAIITWYESVESTQALAPNPLNIETRGFARLFMVPGMAHCGGGPGPSSFDAQRAIEDWVERGLPPARLEASRIEGGEVVLTRPLCPYPQTARYRGNGNQNRSGSFVCAD